MIENGWFNWKLGDLVEFNDKALKWFKEYKDDIGIIVKLHGRTFDVYWQKNGRVIDKIDCLDLRLI